MRNIIFLALITSLIFACSSNDIDVNNKKSESHYQLGLEFAQLSLFKNAIDEFDLAIKFNPNNPNIYSKKGLVLFAMSLYEEAKTNFEKTIKLNPQDTQAYINLGIVKYKSKNNKGALADWEKAVALKTDDNDGKALNNIANIYKYENNFNKAIEYYKRAITFEPGNTTFLNNLGNTIIASDKTNEAD